MKRITIVALTVSLLLLPTMVQAEDLKLTVSTPEAELIWKGLRKLPVEEVEQLMTKMRQQVAEQTKPPVAPAPPPEQPDKK